MLNREQQNILIKSIIGVGVLVLWLTITTCIKTTVYRDGNISKGDRVILYAVKRIYSPYHWGGDFKVGKYDCSSFIQGAFASVGVKMPRRAFEQSLLGKEVNLSNAKEGDLLFFLTDKSRNLPITHVGIYIANGKFIHAASKRRGVIITDLNKSEYYKSKIVVVKRVLND